MFTRDPKTAKIGVEILPLDEENVPEFFKRKGVAELNYTQTVRESSLLKLKGIIQNDKTLRSLDCTDEALLIFLNSRKYDVDRTVLKLKKYLNFRKSYPEMFMNITFEALEPLISSQFLTVPPLRCQDGCAIGIIRIGKYDPATLSVEMIKKMYTTILTQSLRNPMNQINGFKGIYDLDISVQTLRICTPQNLYQVYALGEIVLAGRVKEYHIINMGTAGSIILKVMKMFMSEKMQKRVFIHQSINELLDFFPKAVLPVEYGGDMKECDTARMLQKITLPEELAALNILSN